MKRVALCLAVILLALAGAGCASDAQIQAYYDANATARMEQRPVLEIVARQGEDISFTGVEVVRVYGRPDNVPQHRDYTAERAIGLGHSAIGAAGALGTVWVGGQVAVDLADTVGRTSQGTVSYNDSFNGQGSNINGADDVTSSPVNSPTTTTTSTDDHSVSGSN